ncbi:Mitochondrial import inner membrane translocase subunit tim8 [Spiromyces aspiralis]|uniref:Mitochondrial import inner membrane translocase subunit tim8 n=1 Tax=Spiromyces aspiralis TaxID=68401 RepID=A0ACC1HI75_9FUNG|nr:Mitochondrial import inner membrane translocase subunit tim8 [Spiromyces aspiralis]
MSAEFDEKAQAEITKFLEAENAKAQMQSTIHEFTGRCWDKCISNASSSRLDGTERACLQNCVNRDYRTVDNNEKDGVPACLA